MRRAASVLLAACAVVLLLTWHGYSGGLELVWEHVGRFRLNDLDFILKIAGVALLSAAFLSWPRPRA